MMNNTGITLISEERMKQLKNKLKHPDKDANYKFNQLIDAAQGLLLSDIHERIDSCPKMWYDSVWMPLCIKSKQERYVIAAALIGADLDREAFIKSQDKEAYMKWFTATIEQSETKSGWVVVRQLTDLPKMYYCGGVPGEIEIFTQEFSDCCVWHSKKAAKAATNGFTDVEVQPVEWLQSDIE